MSRILRATTLRRAAIWLALTAGLPLAAGGLASAGDFDVPVYTPYPNRAPEYDRLGERERFYGTVPPTDWRSEAVERHCRIFHERRVDAYGREVMHRMRMCDEGPVYPGRAIGPAEYSYPPRPYYERSGYQPYLRPPVAIGGY